jgi:hypothetical protein
VTYSLETLKHLIVNAQESGFDTATFSEFASSDERKMGPMNSKLLLRHDLDADMEAALEMARMEFDLGIKSTYFVMTQSPIYNLFSRRNLMIVDRIRSMSHEIGLHSDVCHRYKSRGDIITAVKLEMKSLSIMLQAKVRSVSFHQPNTTALSYTTDYSTDGFISAYNEKKMKELMYISDSNRSKSTSEMSQEILGVIGDKTWNGVQLLIHPMWWVYKESTTDKVWNRVIQENLLAAQEQLLATERAYGSRRSFSTCVE